MSKRRLPEIIYTRRFVDPHGNPAEREQILIAGTCCLPAKRKHAIGARGGQRVKPLRVTITSEFRPDSSAVIQAIAAMLRWSDEARSAQGASPSVPAPSSHPAPRSNAQTDQNGEPGSV